MKLCIIIFIIKKFKDLTMNSIVRLMCEISDANIEFKNGKLLISFERELDLPDRDNITADQIEALQAQTFLECLDPNFEIEIDGVPSKYNHTDQILSFPTPFKVTTEECLEWANQQSCAPIKDVTFFDVANFVTIVPVWKEDLKSDVRTAYIEDFFDYFAQKMQSM